MKRLLSVFCITLAAIISSPAQWLGQPADVPAYHDTRFKKSDAVPPILSPDQMDFPDSKMRPVQVHAYELAARIPQVIYQQPCYCYCDQHMGHKSLHSCFEGQHGGECAACLKELYYTYLMTQQKKTPAQIRTGIISGEWQQVDLATAASIGVNADPPAHKATRIRKKATT